jgi:phospholipase/carboxylesterase
LLEELIKKENKKGVQSDKIVLAGFSQGGAIALQTGLRHPRKLAGVMALSTYLPLAESLSQEATPANKATPIFMAHGTYDPVVPLMMGAGSMTMLTGLGYAVEWRQYPMPHSVCPEEIADIGEWLRKILKA